MSASAAVVAIGAVRALADDGAGNGARMPLLAENEDDVGEIAFAGVRDDVGGARALGPHAHVERAVVAEGKAAARGVELHRGDAEIEHDAVDASKPWRAQLIEIGEAVLDQRQPALRAALKVLTQRQRTGVAVDADDLAVGRGENDARIAAGAEGGVDIDAAVTDIEEFDRGAAEHGNVAGWSASDSRKAVAARRHSRAPVPWAPSSLLSARTFWVASASSLRKRPGSQI